MRTFLSLVFASAMVSSCGQVMALGTADAPSTASPPADGAIPWSPRLASPTSNPAPTTQLAPCRQDDVVVTFLGWRMASGSFKLSPRSGAHCGIATNPAFRLLSKYGARVTLSPAPTTQTLIPVVTPANDQFTLVLLQWSKHTGEPNWACRQRTFFTALEIATSGEWLELSFDGQYFGFCMDPLECCSVSTSWPEPIVFHPAPVFDAKIVAPQSAHIGQHLRYLIQLTNSTAVIQRFGECPAYVQNIAGPQELGSSDRPGFRYVERRHILNCAGLGEIAPGATVTFEMYFDIPDDVLPGTYVLPWRLDGPVYSIGYKVSLEIER
jgi:hypothetical protein